MQMEEMLCWFGENPFILLKNIWLLYLFPTMVQMVPRDQWCGLISHNLHPTIMVNLTNEPFKKKSIVHNS